VSACEGESGETIDAQKQRWWTWKKRENKCSKQEWVFNLKMLLAKVVIFLHISKKHQIYVITVPPFPTKIWAIMRKHTLDFFYLLISHCFEKNMCLALLHQRDLSTLRNSVLHRSVFCSLIRCFLLLCKVKACDRRKNFVLLLTLSFSLFKGSFEFWWSTEYWSCRTSFARQGEPVTGLF
jgi:hypothetical protein